MIVPAVMSQNPYTTEPFSKLDRLKAALRQEHATTEKKTLQELESYRERLTYESRYYRFLSDCYRQFTAYRPWADASTR